VLDIDSVVPTKEQLDRLEGALLHIQEHPEEWDQSDWIVQNDCGTVACVAGHVVLREGYPVRRVRHYFDAHGGFVWLTQVMVDGEWTSTSIRNVAQKLLGLDNFRASRLFAPHNSLPELWMAFEGISEGRRRAPQGAVTEEQRADLTRIHTFYRADS
jgi:hypothetical protein